MFFLYLISVYLKQKSSKSDVKETGGNGIINVAFDKNDDDKHVAILNFKNSINPDSVYLMRSVDENDEESFILKRDIKETGEYKNQDKTGIYVIDGNDDLEEGIYSIHVIEDGTTYSTEPFVYDESSNKYMLCREHAYKTKWAWSGTSITFIVLMSVLVLLAILFLILYACRR